MSQSHVHWRQMDSLYESGSYLKTFAFALSRFQVKRSWLTKEHNRPDLEMHLESLSRSRWPVGLSDLDLEELEKIFPHGELSRMFYATRRKCESFHLNYNSHIVLHTEPSRWLRLSYDFGCTPSPTQVSPTFSHYYKSQPLDATYNSFEAGYPLERIMRDALEYSDLAYDYAGDLNFYNGLEMLSKSLRAKYEDDREQAERDRHEVFEQSISGFIW